MFLLLLACPSTPPDGSGDDTSEPVTDSGGDTAEDTGADTAGDTADTGGGDPRCPSLSREEWDAAGVVVQDWSNGTGSNTMWRYRNSEWTGAAAVYNLYSEPGWEAVRFEVDVPSCIVGVEAQWGRLPEGGGAVTLGLYTDFGTNGMDFHPDAPWWTGAQTLDASSEESWVLYELPPFWFPGPGVLYGASFRNGESGPALSYDDDVTGDGSCGSWDDCHSALNYPNADSGSYYNGTTFPWANDFLVRLYLLPMEEVDPASTWFADGGALNASANVSWGDYDDDGDDDLMTNGPTLYRNDGGSFVDVTAESGVAASGVYTSGGAWADYDNDGNLDYFGLGGSTSAGELLLHNEGDGTFTDVTSLAGITDYQSERSCLGSGDPEYSPTAGATWTDFDNDGLVDLVQANFLCFDTYTYYPDRFWHNQGDGTFVALTEDQGADSDDYAGRGAETIDADGDGDLDVSIVNYVLQKNLYYQNAGGTFSEEAKDLGLSGASTRVGGAQYYGHSIGLKWGDLDNDLDWDLVVGNLAHPRFYHFSDRTNVLIQEGGTWTDEAEARGIVFQETHSNPSLLDIENDGDLDLFISEVYAGRPTDIYTNDGAGRFTPARLYAGVTTENGWGTAVADPDRDGDQDYLAYSLFENRAATGSWVQLRLVGDVASNRAAIGAIAWVTTSDGLTRMRSVSGGNGTGCQDSQTLHFGLGTATSITGVEVWYPGGETVSYSAVGLNAAWRLTESGSVAAL